MQDNLAYKLEKERSEGFASSYFNNVDEKKKQLSYRISSDIEETIRPPLRDISYRFAQGLTDAVYSASDEETFPTRREALDYFDKQFMQREITRVKGNLTQYVRDAFGVKDESKVNTLRRNVYRKIGKYGLSGIVDSARPWKPTKLEDKVDSSSYVGAGKVETTLSKVLSGYKDVIQPTVYSDISTRIKEKAPLLAEKISAYMPNQANRLKSIMQSTEGMTRYGEAKAVFEKQIIYDALEAADGDKKKAARYLGDSLRTLNRKIAELGIEDEAKTQQNEENNVVRIEDFVKKKTENQEKPAASEVERLQQLIREYNAKREAESKKKDKKQVKLRVAG